MFLNIDINIKTTRINKYNFQLKVDQYFVRKKLGYNEFFNKRQKGKLMYIRMTGWKGGKISKRMKEIGWRKNENGKRKKYKRMKKDEKEKDRFRFQKEYKEYIMKEAKVGFSSQTVPYREMLNKQEN